MARTVVALGTDAISRSLQILSRDSARGCLAGPAGDSILLTRNPQTTQWARGDTLYDQDSAEFQEREDLSLWRRPLWLSTLQPTEAQFAIRIAEMLVPWWGQRGSVAGWLGAFGSFHSSRRTDIEQAGRYSAMLLEGLISVRSLRTDTYPTLVSTMGTDAHDIFERWVAVTDHAGFLGILLGQTISPPTALDPAPLPEFESPVHSSMYSRALGRTEAGARMLSPVLNRLRKQLLGGL